MKHRKLTTIFFLALSALGFAAFTGCTGLLGDFEVTDETDAGEAGASDLGKACQNGTECSTGFCADGVCCESACKGTCESCALANKGKCEPIPDGTDPEKECPSEVRPDAGNPSDDGGTDASDAEAGDAGDAGAADASDEGGTLAQPDGGLQSSDDKCKGSCNGQRACKYPGDETTCGSKYCGSTSVAAREACNGKGLCNFTTKTCQAYACKDDECGKSCTSTDDCLPTHFCNPQGVCQERFGNGVNCNSPNDCKSGSCSDGVCCNTDCSQVPGGKCNNAGFVGKCICPDCATGDHTCQVFYRDADSDGYGDKFGSLNNGNAKTACVGQPPGGYVADNRDCADADPRAFPGAGFQTSPIVGTSSYDFDCNGSIQKQYAEYPGGTCHFCGAPKLCQDSPLCGTANQQSYFSCALTTQVCGFFPNIQFCEVCGGRTAVGGFTANIPCGVTATYSTCSTCPSQSTGPSAATTSSRTQGCR